MLTYDERRLIFQYCWEHLVASCEPCQTQYRIDQLGVDLYGERRSHLCPECRADLSDSELQVGRIRHGGHRPPLDFGPVVRGAKRR